MELIILSKKLSQITCPVTMDAGMLRSFVQFDTFRLNKRWKSPMTFAALMIFFAFVCFLVRKEQSALAGTILLIVGIGLPCIYIGSFYGDLSRQVRRLKLSKPRRCYTLTLDTGKVTAHNDLKAGPDAEMKYTDLMGVWHIKNAWYIYAAPRQAFILPEDQCSCSAEELTAFMQAHIPSDKLHG